MKFLNKDIKSSNTVRLPTSEHNKKPIVKVKKETKPTKPKGVKEMKI